jgi:aminoglycoside 3-N-acetyltransferase
MLTSKDIHSFLERIGIKRDDTVLVHTSMRSLGEVEGGCDGLIDAFTSYLTDGLFLVPTHTWSNVGKNQPIYDVRSTVPCIGALPTVAAFRKDGVRSLHPTHSVSAFGKRAADFVSGEELAATPCPQGGVWQRLYDEKAKILLLGVGLNRNTYIHAIDEMIDLPDRLSPPIRLTVIDSEGKEHLLNYQKHGNTGSANFENYRKPLEKLGALKNDKLGNAVVGIFDTVKGTAIISMLWSKADYNLCEELKDIPKEYYC